MQNMNRLGKVVAGLLAGLLAGPAPGAVNRRTPVVEAVEKALPSVVNIATERRIKVIYHDPFYQLRTLAHGGLLRRDLPIPPPITRERRQTSLGSGVVIDPAGYILTNYHVIEQASERWVQLGDDQLYEAELLAGDPLNDLALIKIEPREPLRAITFADDDDLLLGETVIALGNPFGFSQTVTVGVLSGINRDAYYNNRVIYSDILQTDAAVNYGSSGGALVNLNGELIGLNVQILQQAQNIGFAVPVKRARALLGRWLSARQLRAAWMGFEPRWTNGVLSVETVDPDGPAARAGLAADSTIRALDGQPVKDLFDFNRMLLKRQPGEEIRLTVRQDGQEKDVTVPVETMPKLSGGQFARQVLGLELSATTPDRARKAGFANGLTIERVLPDGPAALSQLRAGLLVTRINDEEIRSLDDVARALENVRGGQRVTVKLVNVVEQEEFYVAEVTYWDLTAN